MKNVILIFIPLNSETIANYKIPVYGPDAMGASYAGKKEERLFRF
jgi:hypothetical protein